VNGEGDKEEEVLPNHPPQNTESVEEAAGLVMKGLDKYRERQDHVRIWERNPSPCLNNLSTPLSEKEINQIFPNFKHGSDSGNATSVYSVPSLEDLPMACEHDEYATIRRYPPARH
jgi:hypothetical protein